MKPRTRRTVLGLASGTLVAALVLAAHGSYALEALELKTLDLRFRTLRQPSRADTSIVIVDVDNLSLDLLRPTLGRFPWPRDVWAMLVDYLAAGGARAVAFDFTFPEPDLRDPAADSAFARAAADAGMVVQTLTFQTVTDTAQLRRLAVLREDSAALALLRQRFGHAGAEAAPLFQVVQHPYPGLLAAARTVGAINYTPDPVDGTARRIVPWYRWRDAAYPAFALAVAMLADSARFGCGESVTADDRHLRFCGTELPLDRGRLLITWNGPYRDLSRGARSETYRVYPVAQLLLSYEQVRAGREPEVPLDAFAGKVVLVGASGSGLFETRPNPFGAADPGVLIHATVVDNLLNGDHLRRAGGARNAAATVGLALAAAGAVALLPAAWMSALAALALAAVWVGASAAAFNSGLWLDAAAPLLAMLLAFTSGMVINYVTEGRQKAQIRAMFSKYVAPEYVAQLVEDPSVLRLEGRRAELSILFSDIRGFTSISEKMTPQEVIGFLNQYLDEMAQIVKDSGGTLDKFIGDAVMAFWGEPVRHPDHAARACDCALRMRAATARIADRFAATGGPALRIGIGINTAEVVVGNIGSQEHKLDYTVIGDGVNLASRLEGLNKDFATTIIISGATLARLGGQFATRPLGDVTVKGKEQPIAIYELLDRTETPARG